MKKLEKFKELKTIWPVILLKTSLSLLILAIFLVIFFAFNGSHIFYSTAYVSAFKGNEFQIHTINVGQGDSFLIRLPNDKTMLIDCGGYDKGDIVSSYVKQYFKNENLSKIDYFVLTHPDIDHIGGGKVIIDTFEIENLYRPKYYSVYEEENSLIEEDYKISDSYTYDYIVKKAYQKNINMIFSEKGLAINESGFTVEFLSPKKDFYSASNDYSAVIMISCQDKKALFMGDASTEIESTLVSDYGDNLKADILKLGHHGSKTSTSEEFLDIVNPSYAIISVDKNNSYSLPDISVLNRLNERGIKYNSTSTDGNFVFSVENDEVKVALENKNKLDVALLLSITIVLMLIVWAIPIKIKQIKQNNLKK